MAKQIMQFRYYGDSSSDNYPNTKGATMNFANLKSGKIFANYLPITHLKIQTVPGVKFYLNGGINPIMVGNSGTYELDLEGISTIHKFTFDKTMAWTDGNPLIIDIIYEKE